MLPNYAACDRLKAAMLQRAYDLMCDGDATAADAIAEFLPARDADAMFDAWLDDQDDGRPKSRFYEPKV
jgi:predicted transcriptional regulator